MSTVILYLYVKTALAESVTRMLPKIGPRLRGATEKALGIKADAVTVWVIPASGENAPPLQIVGQASDVGANQQKLELWLLALARAWVVFVGQDGSGWKQEVEVVVQLSPRLQCSTQPTKEKAG